MQSLSVPAIHRAARSTVSQTSNFQCTQIEKRLIVIGILLAVLALLGSLWGGDIAQWFGLQLNAHGHTHVHAHGHPFIDARVLWGVPNALDVLSNLAFVPLGAAGLWVLHRAPACTAQHANPPQSFLSACYLLASALASTTGRPVCGVWR
jgi:hypothetical protein